MMSFETHLAQQMATTKIEFQYCQFPFPRRIDKRHTFRHYYYFANYGFMYVGPCPFLRCPVLEIFEWQQCLCILGTVHTTHIHMCMIYIILFGMQIHRRSNSDISFLITIISPKFISFILLFSHPPLRSEPTKNRNKYFLVCLLFYGSVYMKQVSV